MKVIIRRAKSTDSSDLTLISFASKRYWNYPEEYFDIWERELTITPEYINDNIVNVAEVDGRMTGYFSMVEVIEDLWVGKVFVMKGFWLEHLFILPEFIGKGIGSELMSFAKNLCSEKAIDQLYIFSDPYARGFYDKIGAKYIRESPSSIEGRMVSLYSLDLTSGGDGHYKRRFCR